MRTLRSSVAVLGESSATGWRAPGRGSRQARGYGAAWTRLRATVMRRDGYLCQPCRRVERLTPADEVDHVVPKAQGGSDDLTNLEAICTPCHKAKTQREANMGR